MLLAVLVLLAATRPHILLAEDIGWRLSMRGLGPITAGMKPDQVESITGSDMVSSEHATDTYCWYMHGRGRLRGVSIMVVGGGVARVEIDSPRFRTISGARIGYSLEQLKALYGVRYGSRLTVEPHVYRLDSGRYLTLRSNDGLEGVRFEIIDGEVTRFYGGPWEHLLLAEGCS
jgi:hypothetical protein